MSLTGLFLALGFSFIHLSSRHFKLRLFSVNQFTSFVGGISLAYVFFHLIPTVQGYEHEVMETFHISSQNASHLIFGSMLVGIVVFYFLELALKSSRLKLAKRDFSTSGIFWAHIGSYFLYNFIIGILLSNQRFETTFTALLYLFAIGVHFMTNDWVLRHHFEKLYDRYGLKLLVASVLLGWLLGLTIHISHTYMGLLEAFVAGGLILNALKDELPACKGSGMTSFMVGLVFYSGLLMFIL
ncbi:hypothetical protein [Alkalibacterium pelagium]|uniref:ZIP Zinc transporter n=1 Tax=Alkalibacterium pelagium TaxID=426702 RepID=A0A1H7P4W8_9LACT|nr:hypothetical protein [Alkalibacterium pelagium]GEN51534.1 hypothetical protein APE02nite_21990 [Alkalibacterium pelagium]SEL30157.1 hypothetical protein SAMN04488099_11724 [Alkalibacterium pelagium]